MGVGIINISHLNDPIHSSWVGHALSAHLGRVKHSLGSLSDEGDAPCACLLLHGLSLTASKLLREALTRCRLTAMTKSQLSGTPFMRSRPSTPTAVVYHKKEASHRECWYCTTPELKLALAPYASSCMQQALWSP